MSSAQSAASLQATPSHRTATLGPKIPRRGTRNWARYPYALVEEARAIRQATEKLPVRERWGYTEIANALNAKHGTRVHWITVRDWCGHYYRVSR
jgi:hypothetical protein